MEFEVREFAVVHWVLLPMDTETPEDPDEVLYSTTLTPLSVVAMYTVSEMTAMSVGLSGRSVEQKLVVVYVLWPGAM